MLHCRSFFFSCDSSRCSSSSRQYGRTASEDLWMLKERRHCAFGAAITAVFFPHEYRLQPSLRFFELAAALSQWIGCWVRLNDFKVGGCWAFPDATLPAMAKLAVIWVSAAFQWPPPKSVHSDLRSLMPTRCFYLHSCKSAAALSLQSHRPTHKQTLERWIPNVSEKVFSSVSNLCELDTVAKKN